VAQAAAVAAVVQQVRILPLTALVQPVVVTVAVLRLVPPEVVVRVAEALEQLVGQVEQPAREILAAQAHTMLVMTVVVGVAAQVVQVVVALQVQVVLVVLEPAMDLELLEPAAAVAHTKMSEQGPAPVVLVVEVMVVGVLLNLVLPPAALVQTATAVAAVEDHHQVVI
jgi:hypothetical protein